MILKLNWNFILEDVVLGDCDDVIDVELVVLLNIGFVVVELGIVDVVLLEMDVSLELEVDVILELEVDVSLELVVVEFEMVIVFVVVLVFDEVVMIVDIGFVVDW